MAFQRQLRDLWATAKYGAVLAAALGVVILLLRTPLERWSYDLPYLLRPATEITNLVIVYMDDLSHTELGHQPYDKAWDRALHGKFVDQLQHFGAKAIAFDIDFSDPGPNPAATTALANAIREYSRKGGQVVLAADTGSGDYYRLASEIHIIPPHPEFLAATPHWGFAQLDIDPDDAVRKHFHGWENVPSLSWKLASLLGAESTRGPNGQREERWLNYYGPRGTIRSVPYYKVFATNDVALPEFFKNQIVFVGSATQSGPTGKRRDQFHTPYSGWDESLSPGVDYHATQFLNLMRNDWLQRMPHLAELGLITVFGLLAGLGVGALKPVPATMGAAATALLVMTAAFLLVWQTHIWFDWLVIVAVQIPVALAASVIRVAQRGTMVRPTDMTTEFVPAGAGDKTTVADYELLGRIGSGSYGEVFLARSVTGILRAVKIVNRLKPNDARFDREFAGLKKFEPISRSHEGLVEILHVGRNEQAGQLYYVMELADSCASDPDPRSYNPTTLTTLLKSRKMIEADECRKICLALTSALAFLHEQGLVHRDIKPSNIIFVKGRPKLADIGLVTGADETASFVGTEGYIPPEGPGTPASDVFSLGKVLSELMARTVQKNRSEERLFQLQSVIDQACARNLAERHQNGTAMIEAMQLALGQTAQGAAT